MNISEANAANLVINYALYCRDHAARAGQGSDQEAAALILLADKAHKAIGAGIDGDTVRRRWPKPAGWETRADNPKTEPPN